MDELSLVFEDTHPWPHALRFWAKVDRRGPNECWPWTGATFHFGHGAFKLNGRPWGAHRIAWELTARREVPEGLHILHHCDNPPCCNPAHLYLGTLKDNGRDMSVRGRANRKLTPEVVERARARYAFGAAIEDLAAEAEVSGSAMSQAIHGFTFAYLPNAVPPRYHRRKKRKYTRKAA